MFSQPKLFWSDERVTELRTMVGQGVSLNRAAIRLKRTRQAVKKKARELGLVFKSDSRERSTSSEAAV